MTTGKALLGVVAGIAAGAILGAVLASRGNGKKNVSQKGEALIKALNDRIDEKFEELLGSVNGKTRRTKETAD